MNATVTETEVTRYILLSSGEAIVGNLGGLDSSIEITALGSPVNFLSRLDSLTKDPMLSSTLNSGDILVSASTHALISQLGITLDCQRIDISDLGVKIRDFPEATSIYRIEPSDSNYQKVRAVYRTMTVEEKYSGPSHELYPARQV